MTSVTSDPTESVPPCLPPPPGPVHQDHTHSPASPQCRTRFHTNRSVYCILSSVIFSNLHPVPAPRGMGRAASLRQSPPHPSPPHPSPVTPPQPSPVTPHTPQPPSASSSDPPTSEPLSNLSVNYCAPNPVCGSACCHGVVNVSDG